MSIPQDDPMYNKIILNNYKSSVENIFNKYKTKNNFMAVYFTPIDRPFITFKSTNTFGKTYILGGQTQRLGFVYDTKQDFTAQTNSFLST